MMFAMLFLSFQLFNWEIENLFFQKFIQKYVHHWYDQNSEN